MADSVYYVNTGSTGGDGTGGIDVLTGSTAAFASWSDAEAALQGVIATGDRVIVNFAGATPDTTSVTINGWTIADEGGLIFQSHPDHRHIGVWDDSLYSLEVSGNVTTDFEDNVIVRYLQLKESSTGSRTGINTRANAVFEGNIIRSGSGGSSDTAINNSSSGVDIEFNKNIFIGWDRLFSDSSGDGGNLTFSKNTFIDCDEIYSSSKVLTPLFTDNIFYNIDEGITTSVDPLSDYNATNELIFGTGYVNNTNDLINQTIDFVDLDNGDYRIVSTSPLKTAGSDGGQIGAYYEESSVESVSINADIALLSPIFSAEVTAELPEPTSDINLNVSSPIFSIESSVELPEPVSNLSLSIGQPVFSIKVDSELPEPSVNSDITISPPVFSISIETEIPAPEAVLSLSFLAPIFSVKSSVELPSPELSVNVNLHEPMFSIDITSSIPEFNSDISLTISSPIFSIEASTVIPSPTGEIDISMQKPVFSVTMQLTVANIIVQKIGTTINYSPGSNSLVYSAGNNTLDYKPGSNSLIY